MRRGRVYKYGASFFKEIQIFADFSKSHNFKEKISFFLNLQFNNLFNNNLIKPLYLFTLCFIHRARNSNFSH